MTPYRAVQDSKRFCPREKVLKGQNCWECEYYQNWDGNPEGIPMCWHLWEVQQEMKAIDEKFGK